MYLLWDYMKWTIDLNIDQKLIYANNKEICQRFTLLTLCEGNQLLTTELDSQRDKTAESISMSCCYHELCKSLSSIKNISNNLRSFNVEEWYKIHIHIDIFYNNRPWMTHLPGGHHFGKLFLGSMPKIVHKNHVYLVNVSSMAMIYVTNQSFIVWMLLLCPKLLL